MKEMAVADGLKQIDAFYAAGQLQQAISLARDLLTQVTSEAYQPVIQRVLAEQLYNLDLRQHWNEIQALLHSSFEYAAKLSLDLEMAYAAVLLAHYSYMRREFDLYHHWHAKSLELLDKLTIHEQQQKLVAILHTTFAAYQVRHDEPQLVKRALKLALRAARNSNDAGVICSALIQCGYTAMSERQFPRVVHVLNLAEKLVRSKVGCGEDKFRHTLLEVRFAQCLLARKLKQGHQALEAAQEANQLAVSLGSKELIAETHMLLIVANIILCQETTVWYLIDFARSDFQVQQYKDLLFDLDEIEALLVRKGWMRNNVTS